MNASFTLTLTLTLPLADGPPAAEPPAQALQQLQGRTLRRVVVVDDNADAGVSLAAALESRGHRVTLFEDAEALLAAPELGAVDAFVLEIGLPRIDGYQLARRLRHSKRGRTALLIALAGYGQAHDYTLSKAAGSDHHLVKPADLDQLERILESVPAAQQH